MEETFCEGEGEYDMLNAFNKELFTINILLANFKRTALLDKARYYQKIE